MFVLPTELMAKQSDVAAARLAVAPVKARGREGVALQQAVSPRRRRDVEADWGGGEPTRGSGNKTSSMCDILNTERL